MNSYIVEFWSRIFSVLSRISVFSVIRWALPKPVTAAFVDSWVLGHLLLSICCVFIAAYWPDSTFTLLFVIYGAIRVFEVAVYQINVLLFDEYRAFKAGKDYAAVGLFMVLLSLARFVSLIPTPKSMDAIENRK